MRGDTPVAPVEFHVTTGGRAVWIRTAHAQLFYEPLHHQMARKNDVMFKTTMQVRLAVAKHKLRPLAGDLLTRVLAENRQWLDYVLVDHHKSRLGLGLKPSQLFKQQLVGVCKMLADGLGGSQESIIIIDGQDVRDLVYGPPLPSFIEKFQQLMVLMTAIRRKKRFFFPPFVPEMHRLSDLPADRRQLLADTDIRLYFRTTSSDLSASANRLCLSDAEIRDMLRGHPGRPKDLPDAPDWLF